MVQLQFSIDVRGGKVSIRQDILSASDVTEIELQVAHALNEQLFALNHAAAELGGFEFQFTRTPSSKQSATDTQDARKP